MKFIFTCGGTAGHINPALAVASKLREILGSCEILFIGASGMMEMSLVPMDGFDIKGIEITNLSRDISINGLKHNFKTVKNVIKSSYEVSKIIKDFNPDCVIGTGGYVCYPVLNTAHKLGIPTILHESNAIPGLTTRLLSNKVDKLLTGFPISSFGKNDNHIYTGTPVRDLFNKYDKNSVKKSLNIDKPIVLSFMGSLGSGYMNNVMSELISKLDDDAPFYLVHVTGKRYYESFSPKNHNNTMVFEYLNDIAKYMVASDLVICRSGASTLSEIEFLGKPSILVPSPNVTGNHQEINARALEKSGASKVLLENDFDSSKLFDTICSIINDFTSLSVMSQASKALCNLNAASDIADIILKNMV